MSEMKIESFLQRPYSKLDQFANACHGCVPAPRGTPPAAAPNTSSGAGLAGTGRGGRGRGLAGAGSFPLLSRPAVLPSELR